MSPRRRRTQARFRIALRDNLELHLFAKTTTPTRIDNLNSIHSRTVLFDVNKDSQCQIRQFLRSSRCGHKIEMPGALPPRRGAGAAASLDNSAEFCNRPSLVVRRRRSQHRSCSDSAIIQAGPTTLGVFGAISDDSVGFADLNTAPWPASRDARSPEPQFRAGLSRVYVHSLQPARRRRLQRPKNRVSFTVEKLAANFGVVEQVP